MAYSLMFSMPGTPVLFYGEEIGMGENLAAGGREAVRTPMQWTSGKNGGFSRAAPSRLAAPVVEDGYAPEYVNVADQRHDPDSLLQFMRTLARRYRDSTEIGWGELAVLDQPHDAVLAHSVTGAQGRMVALHSFSPDAVSVKITIPDADASSRLVDLLETGETPLGADGSAELALTGYGYRWLRVVERDDKRLT